MRTDANPYRWSLVDPDLFYGRREAAESLVERLLSGDRFAVAGGRRMGKTTLLRWLERTLGAMGVDGGLIVLPVFVDVAELYTMSSEDAYRLLGRRVGQAAGALGLDALPPGASCDGPSFADALRALLDGSRRLGRLQLVFLFDEIERIHATDWGGGFLAHWRMLLNNMGELSRCVSAVFCGAREIYRIAQDAGSPLGNILAWHELEPFTLSETARLMREPSHYPWPDPAVERVFEVSGGQPCLIQFLMQRLCERDVERWPQTIAEAEQRFLREHATVFASWWQSFEEPAQAIYAQVRGGSVIPEGEPIASFPGQGKRALDVLAHTGVVRWDRTARTVQAAGTLFQTWAQENVLPSLPAPSPVLPVGLQPADRPAALPAARPSDEVSDSAAPGSPPSPDTPGAGAHRRIATVLFTDIVGSTRLTAELGDRRWLEVVSAHNANVRQQLAVFRGREVKTMGDGFLALFDAPAAAIRCAVSIASAVRPLGLEVRAGLHAGEYDAVDDDVIGIAISYAAWIMSMAGAGEVVVSETVRGLVAGSGIRLIDLGARRVKGTRERHHIFAVDSDDRSPFPALP